MRELQGTESKRERESWLSGEEKHCGRSKERRNFLTHCLLLPVWDIIMDKELFIPREREVSCTHELKAHFSAQSALWCRHSAASSIFRTLYLPFVFILQPLSLLEGFVSSHILLFHALSLQKSFKQAALCIQILSLTNKVPAEVKITVFLNTGLLTVVYRKLIVCILTLSTRWHLQQKPCGIRRYRGPIQ